MGHRSRPAYTNAKTTWSVGIDPPIATPICCQNSCDPRVENPSRTPYDPPQPAAASNEPDTQNRPPLASMFPDACCDEHRHCDGPDCERGVRCRLPGEKRARHRVPEYLLCCRYLG